MSNEIWKAIPGFDGYEVSNTGKVRSLKGLLPRILKQSNGNGYKFLGLRSNGKTIIIRVHQLVMLAFVGPCPDGMQVCHNDDRKDNNNLDNLRYDTHSENLRDVLRNGNRALSIDDVVEIRKYLKKHGNYTNKNIEKLSKRYNVGKSVIYSSATGIYYKAANEIFPPISLADINRDRVIQIRELYKKSNKSMTKIAKMFGLTVSGVSRIINDNRW